MPELPEVETVVRSLTGHLTGQTIGRASLSSNRVTRGGLIETAESLVGTTVVGIRRRGKHILIDLDKGLLYVHLGMTGKLLWNAVPGKHARVVLQLGGGTLIYEDIRQFGRFEYFQDVPDRLNRLGPDALDIPFDSFYERLRSHKGRIKPLLLNQSFISGLGNIYADELLFAARLHPLTSIQRIGRRRAQLLHGELISLLTLAISHRGSSISDYVDGAGEKGSFQKLHRVYGRDGLPCASCGASIRRIVVAQRGTHFCPRCQRA